MYSWRKWIFAACLSVMSYVLQSESSSNCGRLNIGKTAAPSEIHCSFPLSKMIIFPFFLQMSIIFSNFHFRTPTQTFTLCPHFGQAPLFKIGVNLVLQKTQTHARGGSFKALCFIPKQFSSVAFSKRPFASRFRLLIRDYPPRKTFDILNPIITYSGLQNLSSFSM